MHSQKASLSFSYMYTGPEEAKSSESVVEENNMTGAKVSNGPGCGLLEHSSQLIEFLTNTPSVLKLFIQAAHSSLDEQERQVEQATSVLENRSIT